MLHHTLLGPHLLETPDATMITALRKWRPPVCVLLLDVIEGLVLTRTAEQLAQDTSGQASSLIKSGIAAHVEPFRTNDELKATKLIGRIFIADKTVETHILQSPAETADFHHNLVVAARAQLDQSGSSADRVNYWVIVNEILDDSQDWLRKLGEYEKTRLALAGAAYGCGLYAFANANPPLLGSPHGGREQYDAPTAPGLTHELAHWRDTDAHGLATVLAQANAHNATKSRHKHALLLHQYFKPDDTMDELNEVLSTPGAEVWETNDYLGLWQDGNPPVLTDDNEGKNVRRFERRIYAWFKDEFPYLPVVMSEYGADGRIGRTGVAQTESRGWKAFNLWRGQPASRHLAERQPYLAALKRLESQNQAYSDVIEGYCLFGLGLNIPEFWSYRIDPDPAGTYTGERANAWHLSILDELVPPRLILKYNPKDETALRVGPHAGYDIAMRHRPPFDIAPGHALSGPSNLSPPEYPIVGRAGAWWQIAYRDDWHSPVWVHHDYVERFVGDTALGLRRAGARHARSRARALGRGPGRHGGRSIAARDANRSLARRVRIGEAGGADALKRGVPARLAPPARAVQRTRPGHTPNGRCCLRHRAVA